jgi:amino acid adenylation domain-containing protein
LSCNWDSVEGLFPEGLLEAMFERFTALLQRLAQDESAWRASELDSEPPSARALVEQVNATTVELLNGRGHDERLHAPLLAQIAARPQAVAVIHDGQVLHYGELGVASQRLAAQLRSAGALPNELVAVLMDKGWQQVVAVLGIVRAGAAYLPIDASLPEERIAQLLQLGDVRQVVSVPEVARRLQAAHAGLGWHLVSPALHPCRAAALQFEAAAQAPEDLAYVIFTSGSTGTPKGVMIDHRGALNTVLDINQRYGIGADDAVYGLSSLSFDLSVYDIFGVLGAGGRLVLPRADEGRDPEAWERDLQAHGVTLWNSVPALLQMLLDAREGQRQALRLRTVMLSGDWIPVELPGRLRQQCPQAQLYSLGGATEASIWSIDYPVREIDAAWRSVPYGKALANQQFYALKPDMSLCPMWSIGELYIGGIGLAKGYWGDPVKTAERFVRHPHSGQRLYRTGDLGRLLPDGNLEFLGREDQQSSQGYRIELSEIEAPEDHRRSRTLSSAPSTPARANSSSPMSCRTRTTSLR